MDAPGYGYASASSKKEIGQWGKLVSTYLKAPKEGDKQLIMLLLDINHGLKDTDVMLMDMLKSLKKNFVLVFTKCDKSD